MDHGVAGPTKLSVALGHDLVQALDASELRAVVRHADEVGLHGIWVTDHPAVPVRMDATYPYSDDGTPPFPAADARCSPLVLLSHLAAATERIHLGTAILILPLRHPIVVARETATLDRLSNGRFVLGVGVGWLEGEFDALDQPFAERGARTDEQIEIIRRLWTGDAVAWDGRHHRFDALVVSPTPKQGPRLPVYVGGESPAALRRAARLGDGWIGMVHDPRSAGALVRRLETSCRVAARERPIATVVHAPAIPTRRELSDYRSSGIDELKITLVGPGQEPSGAVARSAIDRLGALREAADRG
jgi:probable F420-dependent oxidoreductase